MLHNSLFLRIINEIFQKKSVLGDFYKKGYFALVSKSIKGQKKYFLKLKLFLKFMFIKQKKILLRSFFDNYCKIKLCK